MCLFLCHLLTHRQICICQIVPFWFWSSGTPKAVEATADTKGCSPILHIESMLAFWPSWQCSRPELSSADDGSWLSKRLKERGFGCVGSFTMAMSHTWSANGTGFNRRFWDEHSKLNFVCIRTTERWNVQKSLNFTISNHLRKRGNRVWSCNGKGCGPENKNTFTSKMLCHENLY